MFRLLVLEPDQQWRHFLTDALASQYEIDTGFGTEGIAAKLKNNHYDVVIQNIENHGNKDLDQLRMITTTDPHVAVIVTSLEDRADVIVGAIRQGANDFVAKPYSAEEIRLKVKKALDERSLHREINYLRRQQDTEYDFRQIIAVSPAMKNVINALRKFAKSDATILIRGETGTGKSFLSGSIHFNSYRRDKPFIKVNCANLPETLMESELFGHERGAFTGADKTRVGRFEQADGGTLFLDEIGEMSPSLQAKMLRVLEEKEFERLGGSKTIHSDVRIIAATNRNLEKEVTKNRFREDLYYRVNVFSVTLPPLRERRACLPLIADYLLQKSCRNLKRRLSFAPTAVDWILNQPWPGNIRQLANAIERAAIIEDRHVLHPSSFTTLYSSNSDQQNAPAAPTLTQADSDEKNTILKALEENLWIQKDAAKQLGISPRMLNYRIKKLGITYKGWRKFR